MRSIPQHIYVPLMLLSRNSLDEAQKKLVVRYCEEIGDWECFISEAARKHCLPLVHRHISGLSIDKNLSEQMNVMRGLSRKLIFNNLKMRSANAQFHKDCIQPDSLRHFYIKGPSLAERYYSEKNLRPARDIDVVVHNDDFEKAISAGLKKGYVVAAEFTDGGQNIEQDTEALVKLSDVVSLLSPEGFHFEVHRVLDRNLGLFNREDLFDGLEEVSLGSVKINVLPTNKLFVYVCYHGTQHMWSRLHWLADLDAISKHPTFDGRKAISYANKLGLEDLVKACLQFNLATARKISLGDDRVGKLAKLYFDYCVANIGKGLQTEYEMISEEYRIGLPKRFSGSTRANLLALKNHFVTGFKPTYQEYLMMPLPSKKQWIYPPIKFYRTCLRLLCGY